MPRVIAGLYLGAGGSRRMGRPKLSIPLGAGERLGGKALNGILLSRLDYVAIVTKDGGKPDWLPKHCSAGGEMACELVAAKDAEQGMAYSIRAGLKAAYRHKPDAVVIMLADQPLVTAGMIDQLIARYENDRSLDYVAYCDGAAPIPPILLAAAMFPALEKLHGDKGARELLRQPVWRGARLAAESSSQLADIDTEEDLNGLRRLLAE